MSLKNTNTMIACALALLIAPVAGTAQDAGSPAPFLIDLFQDRTEFLTYDEFIAQQQVAAPVVITPPQRPVRRVAAPVLVTPQPRAALPAPARRTVSLRSLNNQWTIGAFR